MRDSVFARSLFRWCLITSPWIARAPKLHVLMTLRLHLEHLEQTFVAKFVRRLFPTLINRVRDHFAVHSCKFRAKSESRRLRRQRIGLVPPTLFASSTRPVHPGRRETGGNPVITSPFHKGRLLHQHQGRLGAPVLFTAYTRRVHRESLPRPISGGYLLSTLCGHFVPLQCSRNTRIPHAALHFRLSRFALACRAHPSTFLHRTVRLVHNRQLE